MMGRAVTLWVVMVVVGMGKTDMLSGKDDAPEVKERLECWQGIYEEERNVSLKLRNLLPGNVEVECGCCILQWRHKVDPARRSATARHLQPLKENRNFLALATCLSSECPRVEQDGRREVETDCDCTNSTTFQVPKGNEPDPWCVQHRYTYNQGSKDTHQEDHKPDRFCFCDKEPGCNYKPASMLN